VQISVSVTWSFINNNRQLAVELCLMNCGVKGGQSLEAKAKAKVLAMRPRLKQDSTTRSRADKPQSITAPWPVPNYTAL